MHILLTGATGFIGRRAAQRLVGRGHQVRCLVRASADLSPLQYLPVEVWRGDVTDRASLAGALDEVQAVAHLVGIIRERPPTATFPRVHVEGTRNLLEACQRQGDIHRFLFLSSIGAGPGPHPYLRTKWEAEELVRGSGLPWTILRSSIVFGPGDEFMNRLAALVRRPPSGDRMLAPFVPIIGSGRTRFQPIFVEDVAECILRAVEGEAYAGRTVEIGGPEQFSYEELVDIVMDTLGVHRPKLHLPVALMRPAVALMPLVYREPPLTSQQLAMIELDNVAEPEVVQREFGFAPARLRDRLEYIVEESRRAR
ncbi:MAG: complex I NDUFA9 subunit family protein [Chloroflexi bacterium]|nr:complex I NDUFA9 subunit family protein [Chloroflexota bacterium]